MEAKGGGAVVIEVCDHRGGVDRRPDGDRASVVVKEVVEHEQAMPELTVIEGNTPPSTVKSPLGWTVPAAVWTRVAVL